MLEMPFSQFSDGKTHNYRLSKRVKDFFDDYHFEKAKLAFFPYSATVPCVGTIAVLSILYHTFSIYPVSKKSISIYPSHPVYLVVLNLFISLILIHHLLPSAMNLTC